MRIGKAIYTDNIVYIRNANSVSLTKTQLAVV